MTEITSGLRTRDSRNAPARDPRKRWPRYPRRGSRSTTGVRVDSMSHRNLCRSGSLYRGDYKGTNKLTIAIACNERALSRTDDRPPPTLVWTVKDRAIFLSAGQQTRGRIMLLISYARIDRVPGRVNGPVILRVRSSPDANGIRLDGHVQRGGSPRCTMQSVLVGYRSAAKLAAVRLSHYPASSAPW